MVVGQKQVVVCLPASVKLTVGMVHLVLWRRLWSCMHTHLCMCHIDDWACEVAVPPYQLQVVASPYQLQVVAWCGLLSVGVGTAAMQS